MILISFESTSVGDSQTIFLDHLDQNFFLKRTLKSADALKIPFDLQRVWGRIYSEKVWNQSSSNTKENGSGWGRVVSNIIVLESMDLQLSNALWIEWFGQKLAEIEDFEFGIFLKISKIEIDHFHFLCKDLIHYHFPLYLRTTGFTRFPNQSFLKPFVNQRELRKDAFFHFFVKIEW